MILISFKNSAWCVIFLLNVLLKVSILFNQKNKSSYTALSPDREGFIILNKRNVKDRLT